MEYLGNVDSWADRCWFCELGGCDSFTFEWDADVHYECVKKEAEAGNSEAYWIYKEWLPDPEVMTWVVPEPVDDSDYPDPDLGEEYICIRPGALE